MYTIITHDHPVIRIRIAQFLHRLILFLVCICSIGIFSTAHGLAQVNTEQMRGGSSDQGLSGDIDLNFRIKTGNVDVVDTGSSLRFEYQGGKNRTFLVTNIQYATKESDPFINRGFTHIRYNRTAATTVIWELYTQHQFNEFIRLFSRTLVGAGGRFVLREEEQSTIYLGSSYMVEREHIDVASGSIDKSVTWTHRWSNYCVVNWRSSGRAVLVNSLYVQPRIDGFDDLRILNEFELKTALTSRLSTTLQMSIRYDGNPPSEVEKTDLEIRNTLGISF